MNITMKRTVELRGITYAEGRTYTVNASTWRDLLKAGALKEEVKKMEAAATAEEAPAEESAEVPKLQTKAQAKKPVRRTRKIKK